MTVNQTVILAPRSWSPGFRCWR